MSDEGSYERLSDAGKRDFIRNIQCPPPRTFTESDVREMVAKAYERCSTASRSNDLVHKFAQLAADIRSGKEPL